MVWESGMGRREQGEGGGRGKELKGAGFAGAHTLGAGAHALGAGAHTLGAGAHTLGAGAHTLGGFGPGTW